MVVTDKVPVTIVSCAPDELEIPSALFNVDILVTPVPPRANGKVPLVISPVECVCELFAFPLRSSVVANVFPNMNALVVPTISFVRDN